jgi:hypothetical protein
LTEASIFSRIVRNEDSYTQLLYNLMVRDESLRAVVLAFLLGEINPVSVSKRDIYIQKRLPNGGKPDLMIEHAGLSAIIELKTENERGRTARQLIVEPEQDDPECYLSYLRQKHAAGDRCALVFLVPPAWRERADVEEQIAELKKEGRAADIIVKQVTWQELLHCHEDTTTGLSLWREFQAFLREHFDMIHFTKEEIETMVNGTMTLVSAVKLNRLIEEVRLKAEAHKMPVTKLCSESEEISFYFKRKVGNKEEWPLFFGCCPLLWKTDPRPLCCGVKVDLKDRFENAVRDVLKEQTITDGDWVGVGFPDEDLERGAEAIYPKLPAIWTRL